MDTVKKVPGVIGVAPFVINPMMVTHGEHTATGVLLKGVDAVRAETVLDLPRHIVQGSMKGLRVEGSKPPERRRQSVLDEPPLPVSSAFPGGADEPPKKGRSQGLLGDLERLVREQALDLDAGVPSAAASSGASAKRDPGTEPDLAPGAPVGKIEPEGGFKVALPDDDFLPADIDPDPCRSPEAVARLPGIIIGATLARNLSAKLGDCLQVTSPTIGFVYARGAMHAPVAKQFRVTAIFDAGFDQYDSKLVYTDLYESQAFYDSGDSVTGVEMKVADIDRARDVKDLVDKELANGVYHTLDWEELNHGLFTALRIQQILMSLVLALIIVVAAFTVIATLIMVVLDKKREIAVLKAMGARSSALLRAFLYQGGLIGLIGTVVGLALGYGICKLLTVYGLPLDPKVYFISKLPVLMRTADFVWVGVFAVLVCLVATVWPAQYAARLRPAEAFRENR
jgi:lipoprotein-releasing system permease protein